MAAAARCFNICTRDLNRKCTIESRSVQPPKVGDFAASETFAEIYPGWFAVKTLLAPGRSSSGKGSARFAGVNVHKDATHIFTTRFRQSIKDLDGAGEYYTHMADKYYRILETANYNEENLWLIFQTTERGKVAKEATNA